MADQITVWMDIEDADSIGYSVYVTADVTPASHGSDEEQGDEKAYISAIELNGEDAPDWAYRAVCPDDVLAAYNANQEADALDAADSQLRAMRDAA